MDRYCAKKKGRKLFEGNNPDTTRSIVVDIHKNAYIMSFGFWTFKHIGKFYEIRSHLLSFCHVLPSSLRHHIHNTYWWLGAWENIIPTAAISRHRRPFRKLVCTLVSVDNIIKKDQAGNIQSHSKCIFNERCGTCNSNTKCRQSLSSCTLVWMDDMSRRIKKFSESF